MTVRDDLPSPDAIWIVEAIRSADEVPNAVRESARVHHGPDADLAVYVARLGNEVQLLVAPAADVAAGDSISVSSWWVKPTSASTREPASNSAYVLVERVTRVES
jgi:hypothetical protein